MSKTYTITTTYPHGWDALAKMDAEVVIDRRSKIEKSSSENCGALLVIVDQGSDKIGRSYTRTEVAQQLGLCGVLTETHLLTSALRQYAVIREALGLGDASEDSDWEPYEVAHLDSAEAKDYDMLCATVGIVYGPGAEAAQRKALESVLSHA